MNIVYIIGNGFDLNLGMKTSYVDFYRDYFQKETGERLVLKLKKEIDSKHENWADLELQLGEYTIEIANLDDLDTILFDMRNSLADYLLKQETKFDFGNVNREKLLIDIYSPEESLVLDDRRQIQELKKKSTNPWLIDILTFNYTKSVELIIGKEYEGMKLTTHRGKDVAINQIEHIHGSLEENMVLGVNDVLQLANVDFRENLDIQETLVKPEQNRAIKDGKAARCHQRIKTANLICIYGSSLGKTDKLWWDLIGKRLLDGCFAIIFFHSKQLIPQRTSYLQGREERRIIDNFLSHTQLSNVEKGKIKKRIFVGINTQMFSIT